MESGQKTDMKEGKKNETILPPNKRPRITLTIRGSGHISKHQPTSKMDVSNETHKNVASKIKDHKPHELLVDLVR